MVFYNQKQKLLLNSRQVAQTLAAIYVHFELMEDVQRRLISHCNYIKKITQLKIQLSNFYSPTAFVVSMLCHSFSLLTLDITVSPSPIRRTNFPPDDHVGRPTPLGSPLLTKFVR